MADKASEQPAKPTLTYRGADGKPHMVDDQERAAREAQKNADEKAGQPELPGLINRAPD